MALDGGRAVAITADVVGKVERRATGELAFDAIATRIAAGAVRSDVRVEVAVRIRPDDVDRLAALEVGSSVLVSGTTYPAQPGDRAVLVVAARNLEVVVPASGAAAIASGLRRGLIHATVGLPEPGAGLVPGLAVGDTSRVGIELDTAMKRSSLSHLTAVSGANCALVVGMAFGAAALAGLGRRVRVGCGVAALAGFVVLVTPEPSVVRAAAMAGAAMLAVLLGRPAIGLVRPLARGRAPDRRRPLALDLPRVRAVDRRDGLAARGRAAAGGWPRALDAARTCARTGRAARRAAGVRPAARAHRTRRCRLRRHREPPRRSRRTHRHRRRPRGLPRAALPALQSGLAAIAWVPAAWIAGTAASFAALPAGSLPGSRDGGARPCWRLSGSRSGSLVIVRAPDPWMAACAPIAGARGRRHGGASAGASRTHRSAVRSPAIGRGRSSPATSVRATPLLVRSAGHVALDRHRPRPGCADRLSPRDRNRPPRPARAHALRRRSCGGVDAVHRRVDTRCCTVPRVDRADRAVLARCSAAARP